MGIAKHRVWLSWAAVAVLGLACLGLGILQYRSIGEITAAERNRMHQDLQEKLTQVSQALNEEISTAAFALVPSPAAIEAEGRERAYAGRYRQWRASHEELFRRVGLAVPHDGALEFLAYDDARNRFTRAGWPAEWTSVHDTVLQRLRHEGGGPGPENSSLVFELPRFGPAAEGRGNVEQEWFLFEVNPEVLRTALLPALLAKYLGRNGSTDYDAVVVSSRNPADRIYASNPAVAAQVEENPDSTVSLLTELRSGPGGFNRGPGPPPVFGGPGRLRLMVRSKAGSIETLVRQSQRRNIALTASMMLLIVATVWLLLSFSRQAQRLADMQIEFVAGVSHELRTPLTVIRTAAYNLTGARIRNHPEQVERYGRLIGDESDKLQRLVEDVLRFASSNAGHVIRERKPVEPGGIVDDAVKSTRASVEGAGIVLEQHISPSLPLVLADSLAVRHALQNLIDNARKYGAEGGNWIGIFADTSTGANGPSVEIRVADRGPGIPPDEQSRLFEPFFRGRRAVQDQVHGTGLGLNLARKIIEAHGGSLSVRSNLPRGSEFVIHLPAAPAGLSHEYANSAD